MLEATGLIGLFGLLFLKEAGVPVPIPGDLLVLGTGVAAARGDVAPIPALGAVLLAGYLGGAVQFALLRTGMRRPLLAVLERFGVSRERVERHAERLRERGLRGVAISRATPGIRVIAVAASALAALPFGPFLIGLIVGNTAFVGLHFLLGFVIGPPAVAAVATFGVAITGLAIVLAVLGAAGWWWLRRRRARHASSELDAAYVDWADATCPICLTLGLAGVRIDEG